MPDPEKHCNPMIESQVSSHSSTLQLESYHSVLLHIEGTPFVPVPVSQWFLQLRHIVGPMLITAMLANFSTNYFQVHRLLVGHS